MGACNCFRMPYWKHLSALTGAVERLSYLMTRGERCCEAAIMYPVSAVDGGLDGQKVVDTAFALGRGLYSHGVDFDFLDRASLCAGVAAEQFRFIVVPEMRVMRGDEYRALLDAAQRGVQVVSIGALPAFGPDQAAELAAALTPLCFFAADAPEALAYLLGHAGRDVQPASTEEFYLQHRRYGDVDICMTYGIPKGERCLFRARGKAVWMNPWDGRAYGIPNAVQTPEGVVLDMPVPPGSSRYSPLAIWSRMPCWTARNPLPRCPLTTYGTLSCCPPWTTPGATMSCLPRRGFCPAR